MFLEGHDDGRRLQCNEVLAQKKVNGPAAAKRRRRRREAEAGAAAAAEEAVQPVQGCHLQYVRGRVQDGAGSRAVNATHRFVPRKTFFFFDPFIALLARWIERDEAALREERIGSTHALHFIA